MKDIKPALKLCDILVLPSYREGFPNVILQAGAMETPVIASNISGCNEVVVPGYNGWLLEPRDEKELYNLMLKSINLNKKNLGIIGKRAREIIKTKFERNDHWKRMRKFYAKLLTFPIKNG